MRGFTVLSFAKTVTVTLNLPARPGPAVVLPMMWFYLFGRIMKRLFAKRVCRGKHITPRHRNTAAVPLRFSYDTDRDGSSVADVVGRGVPLCGGILVDDGGISPKRDEDWE